MKCLNSKLITIFICLNLALLPSIAFATTTLGGWTLGALVADGASSIVNGTKNVIINGSNVVKTSTAKITPTAGAVSKVLARGAAGYALSIAVEQLLGSVDWVLDPANNQIVYKTSSTDPLAPSNQYYYILPYNGYNTKKFTTADQACRYAFASGLGDPVKSTYPYYSHAANGQCFLTSEEGIHGNFMFSEVAQVANPNYDIEQDKEKKLSLDTVAAQVISNAESETDQQKKAGAQSATTAAAQDMLANDPATQSDVETQLNTNSKTQTSEEAAAEATPKDPAVPESGTDIKITFPIFCSWAPSVCEAAQYIITKPQTWVDAVSLAWSEFWEEPNIERETDTEVDVEQQELQDPSNFDQNYVQFGGQCPILDSYTITVGPISVPLSFDLSPYCEFALKVRPAIQGFAYLTAMGIVVSAIREL